MGVMNVLYSIKMPHYPECDEATDYRSGEFGRLCICDQISDALTRERKRISESIRTGERILQPHGPRQYVQPAMGRGALVRFRRVMDVIWGDL